MKETNLQNNRKQVKFGSLVCIQLYRALIGQLQLTIKLQPMNEVLNRDGSVANIWFLSRARKRNLHNAKNRV